MKPLEMQIVQPGLCQACSSERTGCPGWANSVLFGALLLLSPALAMAQNPGTLSQALEGALASPSGGFAWTTFALVFVLGFLSSLTPCVYPLIPVTISIFGACEAKSRKQAFLLSLSYTVGIALTYTALGMISARSGQIFGALLGHPVTIIVLALLLVLLALYTLELLPVHITSALQTRASRIGGGGYAGALLMGSVSGVVAAPCIGPVLVMLLGYVATQGNMALGGALLFTYAMGLGSIFLILGTFSGLLSRIPRSGMWLHTVKFFMATAIFMVALFLLQPILPLAHAVRIPAALSLFVALLALHCGCTACCRDRQWQKALFSIICATALSLLVFSPPPAADGGRAALKWYSSRQETLEVAARQNSIAMLDLYADWCVACKELEEITFADPDVRSHLERMTIGRIDFTTPSQESDTITAEYGIPGLPCILFLRPDGSEIEEARITGFMSPDEFEKHLISHKIR